MNSMFDESIEYRWGSYFVSLGLVVSKEDVQALFQCLVDFLKKIGVENNELLIRASSKDIDLVNLTQRYMSSVDIEFDSQPPAYYSHKLGIEGVKGRNFNIAIINKTNNVFLDVGNVISIERDSGEILCYELALGVSTILKQVHSLDHVLDVYNLPNIAQFNGSHEIKKFQDCVISSVILLSEGLRPFGGDNRSRLLKTFLLGVLYFKLKYGVSDKLLIGTIEKFEKTELQLQESQASYILNWINAYSQSLTSKQNISKTEQLIINLL